MNNFLDPIAIAIHKTLQHPLGTEPQLVAKLMWNLIDGITQAKINSTSIGGVFVHASPLVTCSTFPSPTPTSVELGDMLLIRSTRTSTTWNRQALLLQAKMANTPLKNPGSPNQHHLYANAPEFKYASGMGSLNGQRRQLIGPNLYDATQYLLIPDAGHPTHPCICGCPWGNFPCWGGWIAHPTHPNLTHHQCMLFALAQFFSGSSGKSFETPTPAGDTGWSCVINELISIGPTAGKATKFSNYGNFPSPTRGQGSLLALTPHWGNSPSVASAPNVEGNERGLAIIEIVVDGDE